MATVRERNGSYQIRCSAGYNTSTGKQIMKSMTWKPSSGMTKRQIEKELARISAEFEAKVISGGFADINNIKLADFTKQYLEFAKTTLSPSTLIFYKRVIDEIINPSLGHMKLNSIKPIHVQEFIQTLQSEKTRIDGKGNSLAASTVKRYFTVFKSIMAKAYKLDLINSNPTNSAKIDLPKIEEPEVAIFSQEETEQMLNCLDSEPLMFQILIHLAIITGCRRGELVALKWNCINFEQNTVSIKQSNYKLKGENVKSKSPKTKSSVRDIAIPDYLVSMLRDYKQAQRLERLKLGSAWKNEEWLFTKYDGTAMHPHTPTKWFSKFLERHGIPHRKFHALRHTSATLLLSGGTNIKTVAS